MARRKIDENRLLSDLKNGGDIITISQLYNKNITEIDEAIQKVIYIIYISGVPKSKIQEEYRINDEYFERIISEEEERKLKDVNKAKKIKQIIFEMETRFQKDIRSDEFTTKDIDPKDVSDADVDNFLSNYNSTERFDSYFPMQIRKILDIIEK